MSEKQPQKRDALLALYYEGGSAALFDPIDVVDVPDDLDVRICETVLASSPENADALSYLGTVYTRRGEYQKGLDLDLRLVRLRPLSPRVHYNLACSYALLERPEDAFVSLEKAVEYGFDDAEHLTKDEDLNSLHDDPRWLLIVEQLRSTENPEEPA